jgi:hypothetical protein
MDSLVSTNVQIQRSEDSHPPRLGHSLHNPTYLLPMGTGLEAVNSGGIFLKLIAFDSRRLTVLCLTIVVARGSYREDMQSISLAPQPQNHDINSSSGPFDRHGVQAQIQVEAEARGDFSTSYDPTVHGMGIPIAQGSHLGVGPTNSMITGPAFEYHAQAAGEQGLQSHLRVQTSDCQCHALREQVAELSERSSYYKGQAVRFREAYERELGLSQRLMENLLELRLRVYRRSGSTAGTGTQARRVRDASSAPTMTSPSASSQDSHNSGKSGEGNIRKH